MSVVGAKLGTKSWSDAPQNEITRGPSANRMDHTNSATDMEKFNGQDVGEVLNKIADPNYIDPNKKNRAVGNDKLDKEAFMKLMLAQMKNQDPTNPLKSHEMAAQLAQFSSVEQMQNMNNTLTEMQKSQKPTEGFQALNFIGKAVAGDSAKLIRQKGDKDHEISFSVGEDASDADLKVKNADGEVVRKMELHGLKAGENKWVWNGKTETGVAAPAGEYKMAIEAKNSAGKKLAVRTDFEGTITGVSYTLDGPVLLVGNQAVKLKDVKKIVDPSLNREQKAQKNVGPDLKTQPTALETVKKEDEGAPEAAQSANGMLTSVGMSNGMMERFKQETGSEPNVIRKPESRPEMKPETSKDAKAMSAKQHGARTSGGA